MGVHRTRVLLQWRLRNRLFRFHSLNRTVQTPRSCGLVLPATSVHLFIHQMSRSRNKCFTIFLIPEDHGATLARARTYPSVKYIGYGVEQAPTTGRTHFQGYIEFDKPTSVEKAKEILGDPGAHLEARKGTAAEARAYCMGPTRNAPHKPVNTEFFEWGEISAQGARTDISSAVATLREEGYRAVVRDHPEIIVRYPRGIQTLFIEDLRATEPPAEPDLRRYLLYGPPGAGKTYEVGRRFAFGEQCAKLNANRGWFDAYQGQIACLLDEFSGRNTRLELDLLLTTLDVYPAEVPVKGSQMPMRASHIFISCNHHPKQWYDFDRDATQYGSLQRRFTHVLYFPNIKPDRNGVRFFELERGTPAFDQFWAGPPVDGPAKLMPGEKYHDDEYWNWMQDDVFSQ